MSDPASKTTKRRPRHPAGIVMADLAHKCAEYVRSDAREDAKAMVELREQLARIYPEAVKIEDEWWGSAESHG